MNKAHPLTSPMVVRSLDVKKNPFRHCEKGEELLGPEVPYLSSISALMYLATCTHPDIAFSVNLLARYSFALTRRHWNGIKLHFQHVISMSVVSPDERYFSKLYEYIYILFVLLIFETIFQSGQNFNRFYMYVYIFMIPEFIYLDLCMT